VEVHFSFYRSSCFDVLAERFLIRCSFPIQNVLTLTRVEAVRMDRIIFIYIHLTNDVLPSLFFNNNIKKFNSCRDL